MAYIITPWLQTGERPLLRFEILRSGNRCFRGLDRLRRYLSCNLKRRCPLMALADIATRRAMLASDPRRTWPPTPGMLAIRWFRLEPGYRAGLGSSYGAGGIKLVPTNCRSRRARGDVSLRCLVPLVHRASGSGTACCVHTRTTVQTDLPRWAVVPDDGSSVRRPRSRYRSARSAKVPPPCSLRWLAQRTSLRSP